MNAKFALIQLEDNLVMSVDVYETHEDAVAERYNCQKSLEEDYPNGIKYFYDEEDYFCAYSDEFSTTYSVKVIEIANAK